MGNTQLLTKVYFPRLVIPVSSVLVGLVDFGIASSVMVVLMAYHHIAPTLGILVLPLMVLFAVFAALSVGLIPVGTECPVPGRSPHHSLFLIQIWMFATPIVYPSSLPSPTAGAFSYGLNPMVGVVDGFRWALRSGKWNGSGPDGSCVCEASTRSVYSLPRTRILHRRMGTQLRGSGLTVRLTGNPKPTESVRAMDLELARATAIAAETVYCADSGLRLFGL